MLFVDDDDGRAIIVKKSRWKNSPNLSPSCTLSSYLQFQLEAYDRILATMLLVIVLKYSSHMCAIFPTRISAPQRQDSSFLHPV